MRKGSVKEVATRPGRRKTSRVTLFELLPSLKSACRPRFDPVVWPASTHYHLGRIVVDDVAIEDFADCYGTPSVLDGVLVTRVRSVIAGVVRIDGECGDIAAGELANRHSVQSREFFALGDTKIELPSDVRAGDVLAVIPKA